MIAIKINDLKHFMNLLLMKETFDSFLLVEATIQTAQTFYIDGRMNKDFYTKEELENNPAYSQEFSSFAQIRPVCCSLVRGTHTPLHMKFVLHASAGYVRALLQKHHLPPDDATLKALILTIRYDGSQAVITTGCAYHTFVPDKTIDSIWDHALKASFESLGIAYDELV